MKRSLTLKRESLASLTADDLGGVVGGAITGQARTCPLADCLDVSRLFVMSCPCQSYPNCAANEA